MNTFAIERQQINNFKEMMNSNLVEKVTIYCEHMKDGETNTQTWTVGVGETYTNVSCLTDSLSQYNVKSYPFANATLGKAVIKIPYETCSLVGKKNIKVIFNNSAIGTFFIVKAVPVAKLSNGYLSWCLLER